MSGALHIPCGSDRVRFCGKEKRSSVQATKRTFTRMRDELVLPERPDHSVGGGPLWVNIDVR